MSARVRRYLHQQAMTQEAHKASGLAEHLRRVELANRPARGGRATVSWWWLWGPLIFTMLCVVSMQLASISVSLRSIAVSYGVEQRLKAAKPKPAERRAPLGPKES